LNPRTSSGSSGSGSEAMELTREEIEIAAQAAEAYAPGYGNAYVDHLGRP